MVVFGLVVLDVFSSMLWGWLRMFDSLVRVVVVLFSFVKLSFVSVESEIELLGWVMLCLEEFEVVFQFQWCDLFVVGFLFFVFVEQYVVEYLFIECFGDEF